MKRAAAALMAVATFVAGSAVAHTELAETVPANGATIAEAPESLQLRFSEAVRLTALSVQKDGGQKQSLGPLPAAATAEFSVALPASIDDGHYVVSWRALSEDTHVMTGEFMFVVGDGSHANHADASAAEPLATPAGAQHGGAH